MWRSDDPRQSAPKRFIASDGKVAVTATLDTTLAGVSVLLDGVLDNTKINYENPWPKNLMWSTLPTSDQIEPELVLRSPCHKERLRVEVSTTGCRVTANGSPVVWPW